MDDVKASIEGVTESSVRSVQSVEVGGRVLSAVASGGRPLKLREIAAVASLPDAQTHAYLVSFRKSGLVEQTDDGRYELGPLALEIGLIRLRSSDPYEQIWTALPACSAELGLAMTMSVWGPHGATIIRVFDAPYQIYTRVRPGGNYGLLNTATGRLFAAFMPAAIVEPILKQELREAKKVDGKIVDLGAYRESLEAVRYNGCATTRGLPVPGIGAISVPIFDVNDTLLAAVTAIGPERLIDDEEGSPQRDTMLAFGRRMSLQLGAGQLRERGRQAPHKQ